MKSRLLWLGIVVGVLCAAPVFGQAVFSVASFPTIGADIGIAELTGALTLSVASGTTADSSFVIHYSAPITNNTASEITIVPTWGVWDDVGLDRDGNNLLLHVPASGGPGNQIILRGVRVSLADATYSKVTATITGATASGNLIMAGQNVLTVIGLVESPFGVTVGNPITWSNGQVVNSSLSITVTGNYAGVFTSDMYSFGQTARSMLRFTPLNSIPPGVAITFPKVVTAETGATFTTASGDFETVPRSDGSTSVTYQFSGVADSKSHIETYVFGISAAVQSPATNGKATFQVVLLPVGLTIPNSTYPSTDIPRYLERLRPDETDLGSGSAKLVFPFQALSASTWTGIATTNPSTARVNVTLTAYDAAGTVIPTSGVDNPQTVTLPRTGQLAKLASELFGPYFNVFSSGTIVATAKTSLMPGFYMEGVINGLGLDGGPAEVNSMQMWLWPAVSHDQPSPFTIFKIHNPGVTPVSVNLKLYDSGGSLINGPVTRTVDPNGTLISKLEDIFSGVNVSSFAGGYVIGQSDGDVVVAENYGNALEFAILPGMLQTQQGTFYIPHFASGAGNATELNLINRDVAVSATLTLTPLDSAGVSLASPVTLNIPPSTQVIKNLDQLIPSLGGSTLNTGSLRIDVLPVQVGPFTTTAPVTGSVRFTTTSGSSAALPLLMTPMQSFIYSHVAQALGYYTGITIFNPNTSPANITIQVFKSDGTTANSVPLSRTLQPKQKLAQLLYELIPASRDQVGGYIQIQSDQPVVSFALFGTSDGKMLSAIPPQRTEQ